jgi:K+-sensing histidine kinase KdpD
VILSSSDGGDFSDQFIPWPEQGDAQSDKDNRWITLAVSNLGPCFTQCNTADLFSSMVSQRDRQYRSSDQAHLGLGLYIVRLIAEYHKGRYFALNRSDARGVVVGIRLPDAGD